MIASGERMVTVQWGRQEAAPQKIKTAVTMSKSGRMEVDRKFLMKMM